MKNQTLSENKTIAMVSDLLRGLRHELSNLTTVLNLNIDLLERSISTEANRLELAELKLNLSDLSQLLARLRLYPQPQAADELFDVVHVALNAVDTVRAYNKQPINCHMPTSPIWIKGSELNLCLALCEILNNALEASALCDNQPIDLIIEPNDTWVSIRVVDQGIGFSAEQLAKELPFEPGYTTKVRKGFVQGLGFGLFMARAVVDLQRGSITLQNRTDGRGAMVTIILPRTEAAADA